MWSSTAESWRFKDCRNCLSLTPPQTAFCPSSSRIHRRVTQKKKHWRKHFSFLILSSPTTRVLGRQKLPSLNWLKAHHYQLTYDHRSSIQIKDLLLSDHARFPVFHVEFKDKEDSKDFPVAPLTRTGSRKDSRKNMNKRSSVRFERSQNKCTLSVFSIPIIY